MGGDPGELVILTPLGAGALVVLFGYGITWLIGLWEPVAQLLLGAAHVGIARADDLARWLSWLPAP